MKKLFINFLLLCFCMYSNAQATDLVVDCQTPGWLSSYISPNDLNTVRNLKVTGTINPTDLATIGNLVKNYNLNGCLDLSEVNIAGEKLSGDMFGVSECLLECFRIPQNIKILEGACDWVALDTLIAGGAVNPDFTYSTTNTAIKQYYSSSYVFNVKHLVLCEGSTSLSMVGYGKNSPLQSISFPESMKAIYNLSYFPNLISYNLPPSIEVLGTRAHTGMRVESDTLFVPKSVKEFYDQWASDDGYYGKGGHIKCIYLPDGLEKLVLTHNGLHYGANVVIHINRKTPPEKVGGWFESPTVVYVPVGCKDIYMSRWENATILEEVYAEKISISVPSVMYMNETYNLSTEFTPNNTTFKDVKWYSSDNTIVSLSNSGVCKPIACGEVLISAENADKSCKDTKAIRIYSHTSGVSISEASLTMKKGDSQLIQASTLPLETSDGRIEWSTSNDKIATVDNNGKISAIAKGKCIITATSVDGGYTVQCEVTVLQPVESLSLEKHSMPMKVGDVETMLIQVTPSFADNKNVTWSSSNEQVASVDANGKVKALKAGETWIKAVSVDNAEAKDSCKVTVTQPVTGITLSKENYTFDKAGESVQLTATILPEDASNKEVRWSSSNENVCIVQNGLVTAVAAGTATVTVTTVDGNFTANCIVKVVQHVTKVEMNKTALTLKVGDEYRLTASVSPDNAENRALTWMSSDEKIAVVDANGNVKALKAGETWIKAVSVDNTEAKDSCKVTILQPVTGITISLDKILLKNIGENIQLEATVLPEDASNKQVKWSSTNEAVCMVANGKVIATGFGTGVVIATTVDGGYMASCTVVVEKEAVPVTSIELSQTSVTIKKGEILQLTATVKPEDATNKNVTWKSSDESICAVTQTGLVVGINEGKTYISVVPENGTAQAKCEVTVSAELDAITEIVFDGQQMAAPVYDMMGRKVKSLVKGKLYVCNGKKFMAK